MQIHRIAPLAVIGVLAAGAFLPAAAAPAKKPISKAYDMHLYPGADACGEDASEGVFRRSESFKATGPGTLTVKITNFEGDWDLSLFNSDKVELTKGGGSVTGEPKLAPTENMIFKIKKAGEYTVRNCNFGGTPDAKGSYLFKPTK